MRHVVLAVSAAMLVPACAGEGLDAPVATTTTLAGGSALSAIQQSIFTPTCGVSGCHDPLTRGGSLDLSSAQAAHSGMVGVASTCAGKLLVAPGNTAASYLLDKLGDGAPPCGLPMPIGFGDLSPSDLALIRAWIDAGAPPADGLTIGTTTTSTVTTPVSSTTTTTTEDDR